MLPHRAVTYDKLFFDTLDNLGLPKTDDPFGGDITGYWLMRGKYTTCIILDGVKNPLQRPLALTNFNVPTRQTCITIRKSIAQT
jgi:hypothetical protein